MLSRDVKEVDEGRICYLWQCIILVDGAPVTFILCTMDTAQDDRKPCLQSGLQSSKESQLYNSVTGFHLHLSVKVSELNAGLHCAAMPSEMRQCSHPGRPKYLSALPVVCSSQVIITDFKWMYVSSFITFRRWLQQNLSNISMLCTAHTHYTVGLLFFCLSVCFFVFLSNFTQNSEEHISLDGFSPRFYGPFHLKL